MAAVTNNVTDGKSKKSFSTVRFMHISDYVRYLRRKQTVTHLPTPPENDTTLICDMQKHFYLAEGLLCSFNLLVAPLKTAGCDVWQLECQASYFTASVRCDNLLHGYMLPVFLVTDQSHRILRSAVIHPMSQQAAAATRPYR